MFMSPQGYRTIDFGARVSSPMGASGQGISAPFITCPVPSRVAAASNATLLRVSLANANGILQEFWFDLARGRWTGPHTLPATMIQAYQNTFILAPLALPNSLWRSDWFQTSTSIFTEVGQPMVWSYQTSMLPNPVKMAEYEMHETVIKLSTGLGATANAIDDSGNVITNAGGSDPATATLPANGASSNWGAAQWQGTVWYGQAFALQSIIIPWGYNFTFSRLSLQLTGTSDSFTRVGALSLRYEELGYLPQPGN
jgi:hypothetical protein